MRYIILIFLLLSSEGFHAQNPNNFDTAWVSSFGGLSVDIGRDIKETSDKGFIIAGNTSSFGNGNSSFYIIKTDSLGHHLWCKALGSSQNDIAYSVEIANDKGYFFAGITNWNIQTGYDGFLFRTDSLGNVLWTKNYGGNDWDFLYNTTIMPDGGLLLCGETYSKTKGGSDAYLIRTKSNGDTLWSKKIGTTGDDAFYSVEQKNNRIYVVGKMYNPTTNLDEACIYKLDFSGAIINQNLYSPGVAMDAEYRDLYVSNGGDILLGGKRTSNSTPYYILRKIDSTNFSQINSISSTQNFYFDCVIEGNNNDVYTLGPNVGGLGGLAALYLRFSSGFTYQNSADFGGVQDDAGFEIIKTSKGYAFIGWTKSYGNQNNSVDENVYLVIFNKKDLVNDYFILLNEFYDDLPLVSINENKLSITKTNVYPNPLKTSGIIQFDDNRLNGKTLICAIFDELGGLINSEEVVVTDNQIQISRKNMKTGIYTYNLKLNSLLICKGKLCVD